MDEYYLTRIDRACIDQSISSQSTMHHARSAQRFGATSLTRVCDPERPMPISKMAFAHGARAWQCFSTVEGRHEGPVPPRIHARTDVPDDGDIGDWMGEFSPVLCLVLLFRAVGVPFCANLVGCMCAGIGCEPWVAGASRVVAVAPAVGPCDGDIGDRMGEFSPVSVPRAAVSCCWRAVLG